MKKCGLELGTNLPDAVGIINFYSAHVLKKTNERDASDACLRRFLHQILEYTFFEKATHMIPGQGSIRPNLSRFTTPLGARLSVEENKMFDNNLHEVLQS